jgi:YfiH family protein
MDRRRLDGDVHALVAPALERLGVLAAFTERTGGVSPAPFDSLNLGFRTGDSPERVAANRIRVVEGLSVPPFAVGRQVHGSGVALVGRMRAGAGFATAGRAIPGVDALAVTRPGVPVAVLVADCVPVVLAGPDLVAVVHAGWRGLAAGIMDRVLGRFVGGAATAAAVGPAIGPCHYEVEEDVARAVGGGAAAGARVSRRGGRTYLDLPGTVTRILRAAGIRSIDRSEDCTACEERRFFSRRRDGTTGRQVAVAMRL